MKFKHTNEEVLEIKDSEKIKAIENHLISFRNAFFSFDFMQDVLQEELNVLLDKEKYINKNIEHYKKVKTRYEKLLENESILEEYEKQRIKGVLPFIEESTKKEGYLSQTPNLYQP